MRFLRTNTAVRVTVGPFFDKTDGVTPEVAITVTSCKLTLMVDDANVPTLVLDTAPTASGGANDMVHVTGDDAGFYDLELAAANVNYLGRAMLAITDAATHCPVFHEFMILPANIYDAFVLGTANMKVDLDTVKTQTVTCAGGVTVPAATLASTTNITAGTIATATAVTTVNGLANNVITAAAINAAALNGKGDWNIGKTGYALSAAGVQAIWDALTSALTTVGSIGKLLVDNINATLSSRATQTSVDAVDDFVDTEVAAILAAVDTEVAAIKAQTDKLTFNASNQVTSDLRRINNTAVNGDGAGTPWGP